MDKYFYMRYLERSMEMAKKNPKTLITVETATASNTVTRSLSSDSFCAVTCSDTIIYQGTDILATV